MCVHACTDTHRNKAPTFIPLMEILPYIPPHPLHPWATLASEAVLLPFEFCCWIDDEAGPFSHPLSS